MAVADCPRSRLPNPSYRHAVLCATIPLATHEDKRQRARESRKPHTGRERSQNTIYDCGGTGGAGLERCGGTLSMQPLWSLS